VKKYKVGALAGKFLPPQIGHAELIRVAAQQSEVLYVVLAENPDVTAALCRADGLQPISAELRLEWLREHFKGYNNIIWLYMDERVVPPYPHGTAQWSAEFKRLIGKKIDAKFFGEEAYFEMNELYFPESAAVLVKRGVDTIEISATQIRANPEKCFEFLIPPAREYFKKMFS
jgi:NadR type nicotinamide-nucleotide adenylyltransferase